MTVGFIGMLTGLFIVPLLLLMLGHKFRRRTAKQRAVFWWALSGHILAILLATFAAFWPPAFWAATDTARGFMGFWAFLLLPLAGAIGGFISTTTNKSAKNPANKPVN